MVGGLHLDQGLSAAADMLRVYLQLVIEAQLDVRHAAEEDLHHDLAIDITSQHSALVAHEHVDLQACNQGACSMQHTVSKLTMLWHQ